MVRSHPWSDRRTVRPLYYEPLFFNILFCFGTFYSTARESSISTRDPGVNRSFRLNLVHVPLLSWRCSQIFFHFSTPVKMYSDQILPRLIYNFSSSSSQCAGEILLPRFHLYSTILNFSRNHSIQFMRYYRYYIELGSDKCSRAPVRGFWCWCLVLWYLAATFLCGATLAWFCQDSFKC